jgi:hypothetical protein
MVDLGAWLVGIEALTGLALAGKLSLVEAIALVPPCLIGIPTKRAGRVSVVPVATAGVVESGF